MSGQGLGGSESLRALLGVVAGQDLWEPGMECLPSGIPG